MEKRVRTVREGGTGSASEQDIQPQFLPDKYEPGSHNAIGIIGLSAGVKWVSDRTVEKLACHDLDLVRTFIDGVGDVEGLTYYGPQGVKDRIGVFSIRVDGFAPHELSAILEANYGILTRSGIHCAPLCHQALGTADRGGATRFSFGPFLSKQDVSFATDALAEIASSRATVGQAQV
jgi:selenocysteine lyase/cysteine desulfurase